jgi:hypothetical protein
MCFTVVAAARFMTLLDYGYWAVSTYEPAYVADWPWDIALLHPSAAGCQPRAQLLPERPRQGGFSAACGRK